MTKEISAKEWMVSILYLCKCRLMTNIKVGGKEVRMQYTCSDKVEIKDLKYRRKRGEIGENRISSLLYR